jgi:hypothetical protein
MMRIFFLVLLVVAHSWSYGSEAARDARDRYLDLQQRAQEITKTSPREAVTAALGEPLDKGTNGWADMGTEVWRYLDYTDDDVRFGFSVNFSPKLGTYVSAQTLRRSERTAAKQVARGLVLRVHHGTYDDKRSFLCDMLFYDGSEGTVAVSNRLRVKGEPAPGAHFRSSIAAGRNSSSWGPTR